MVLDVQNVTKSFGIEVLFKNISFQLEAGEKAALIGRNGCGKSTLMKMITGEEEYDSGLVVIASDTSVGYLSQEHDITSDISVYAYVEEVKKDLLEKAASLRSLEKSISESDGADREAMLEEYARLSDSYEMENGYSVSSEITGTLKGLGFVEKDFDRTVSSLSGGEKTRLALARLLLSKPSLLLLDEPTNHLDIDSVSWLENYLASYKGAVLVVSHDRFFLNKVVTRCMEIVDRKLVSIKGNYDAFREKQAALRAAALKAYIKQSAEIQHQEKVIRQLRSFSIEKAYRLAQNREKKLEKTVRLEKPVELTQDMHLHFSPDVQSGKDVLLCEDISKSFGQRKLFDGINIDIKRGERIGLIGANGAGKTTLIKIITGITDADSGIIKFGTNVETGYFDQEQQIIDPVLTVFEEIQSTYPDMNNTEVRNLCAAFLFFGDDVFLETGQLSGGEKSRVSLAKLMLSGSNFLILDEPTNHLDISSREVLEDALKDFPGTVLFVSHDRYFINSIATRIIELKNGRLTSYQGNYDYYLEKRSETAVNASDAVSRAPTASNLERQARKQRDSYIRKLKNDIAKTEEKINSSEEQKARLEAMLNDADIASDHIKLSEISSSIAETDDELAELYERWESLSEELSEAESV